MSDRSIAEIIGWVRCGRCKKHWNLGDEWGSERPINESPTVDDMVAWLHENDIDNVLCESIRDDGVGYLRVVTLRTAWPAHELLAVHTSVTSTLQAVEKAVRAVDSPVAGVADDGTTTDGGQL